MVDRDTFFGTMDYMNNFLNNDESNVMLGKTISSKWSTPSEYF
jgi:hypothetical protein